MANVVIEKTDLLREFAANFLSVWGPLPSYDYDPILPPPPLYAVYVYTVYLFT